MKKVNWKVYNEALGALQAQFTEWDCIRIFNTNFGRQDAPVRLGVQWGSLGIKSPAEAAEYANRILDAAMAAENFGWRLENVVYIELLRKCANEFLDVQYSRVSDITMQRNDLILSPIPSIFSPSTWLIQRFRAAPCLKVCQSNFRLSIL